MYWEFMLNGLVTCSILLIPSSGILNRLFKFIFPAENVDANHFLLKISSLFSKIRNDYWLELELDSWFWKLLIKPIRKLGYQSPILDIKIFRGGILRIYYKEIGSGSKTPLKAHIYIDIINLIIVLRKCG